MSIQSLLDYISVTPDIRQQGKVKHKLSAILFLTVCAVIAGADEWQEIEDFGHERLEWLKKYDETHPEIRSENIKLDTRSIG